MYDICKKSVLHIKRNTKQSGILWKSRERQYQTTYNIRIHAKENNMQAKY